MANGEADGVPAAAIGEADGVSAAAIGEADGVALRVCAVAQSVKVRKRRPRVKVGRCIAEGNRVRLLNSCAAGRTAASLVLSL